MGTHLYDQLVVDCGRDPAHSYNRDDNRGTFDPNFQQRFLKPWVVSDVLVTKRTDLTIGF